MPALIPVNLPKSIEITSDLPIEEFGNTPTISSVLVMMAILSNLVAQNKL